MGLLPPSSGQPREAGKGLLVDFHRLFCDGSASCPLAYFDDPLPDSKFMNHVRPQ
jgi:hypothetical protein